MQAATVTSHPNLTAVHAGASMRKAQHLQPKASDTADAEVGCFAFSRLAAHIRVLSNLKSGENPGRNLEFPLLSTTENHRKLLRARRTTEPAAMP